ncbi:MAG TPA: mannose-1-phosphate guanylyltransferase, partial [Candidatus Marinimicrobia bacterium]|nr:mannose-1-phosphate guanylyltransferase [Candidatus Neomarinimicrobiota bacterium]
MYCVVMAGGSGTRFWPLSRQAKPKQLLKIIGNQTMLQITVDRLSKCRKTEDIYIATR